MSRSTWGPDNDEEREGTKPGRHRSGEPAYKAVWIFVAAALVILTSVSIWVFMSL